MTLEPYIKPVYDLKLLTDLKLKLQEAHITSADPERELVHLTYLLLNKQIIVNRLNESQRLGIAVCLILWGFGEHQIQKLLAFKASI